MKNKDLENTKKTQGESTNIVSTPTLYMPSIPSTPMENNSDMGKDSIKQKNYHSKKEVLNER